MNGFNECDFLCQAGKYEEAIKVYDEVLKIDPLNANMWNKKGTALNELKRFEEAIKAYDEALKIDPQFAEAWINKGYVYIKLKRYKVEKGNYYEGYEALRGDEFSRKFLKLWVPKGYYECDIHEPIEECDRDFHEPIDCKKLRIYELTKYFHELNNEINNLSEMETEVYEFRCMFLNFKMPEGYYDCDIYESVEECDRVIHEPIDVLELGDYELIKYFHELNNEINNRYEMETEENEFSRKSLNLKISEGYYECEIYESIEECDRDFHDPIDSVEIEDYNLIEYFHELNNEIYNRYEMETEENEFSRKSLDLKMPEGYYECDIYESEIIDFDEEKEKPWNRHQDLDDRYEDLDYENWDSETIEDLQGDYYLWQYYCNEEVGPRKKNLNVCYNGERFVTQAEYEAQLDRYPREAELERYENQLDNYRSKEELQREEDDYQAIIEVDKDLYPWEWYPQIQAELEDPEPWEFYPEVLEALWKNELSNGYYDGLLETEVKTICTRPSDCEHTLETEDDRPDGSDDHKAINIPGRMEC